MSKNHFLLLILIIVAYSPLQAQTYSPQQIQLAERFDSLANNAPRESAYIQTSKDIYETGEDLWFKVYLLNSSTLRPSELSKTLYLQLVTEDTKKTVWQEKYEIEGGFSNGRILLSDDMDEGNYLIEAFTANSFFADSCEFTSVRKVKVVKDITHLRQLKAEFDKKYYDNTDSLKIKLKNPIQFNVFPEGGTIISGIKSRVAFKAINISGVPVNVNGTLYKNDTIELEFSSTHDGMGSFDFMPVKNAKYYIRLKESLTDSIYSFPEIEPEGMTIRLLSRDKDYLNFLVSKNYESLSENIYLMVQIRGVIYGLTEAKLDKIIKIKLPLSDMPQGIAEVTLFNDKMIPVAERLVYVNPQKRIKIQTILTDSIFLTRGKVNLRIITRDENNKPIKANLGLGVFDKLYENSSDTINILTHMYLATQLKGRIYNPGYYFNEKNLNRVSALDLLLLTQGWRKYIWNEANLNKSCTNNEVISDEIKGSANLAFGRKRVPKGEVNIMTFSPEKDSVKKVITVDSVGSFGVNHYLLKNFKGKYIYLKPIASSNATIKLEFIYPFDSINHTLISKRISTPLNSPFREMTITEPDVNKGGAFHIKDVVIHGARKDMIRGKYFGTLDSIANLTLDVNTDFVGICGGLNCPKCKKNGDTHPAVEGELVRDSKSNGWVVYHHVPSKLNLTEEELLKLNNLYRIRAYYGKHEFYQPNYDKEYKPISVPDYRNTLMWAPSIITDDKGEATVNFFCSDYNTEFVGRIEGVSREGLLGTGYFNFTVRKLKFNP